MTRCTCTKVQDVFIFKLYKAIKLYHPDNEQKYKQTFAFYWGLSTILHTNNDLNFGILQKGSNFSESATHTPFST